MPIPSANPDATPGRPLFRRHLLAGWTGLLFFLTLGIALEVLHGLKAGFYLDPQNTTRRLMWKLAHAHGTLFSLVSIAFAFSANALTSHARLLRLSSACLLGAMVIMPLGFFLGGVWTYGGDPGLGVWLVPLGALMMLIAVGAFVLALLRQRPPPDGPVPKPAALEPGRGPTSPQPMKGATAARERGNTRQR